MNQKGQAFSTFKLLIAAVVAIVILTILMQIIGIIPTLGTSDPPKAAADLVQELSGKYAYEKPTSNIEFKLNDSINAKGVAKSTNGAVQEEEVCLYLGDFADYDAGIPNANWSSNEFDGIIANQITYTGTTPQKARLVGMCDTGKELLGTIESYGTAIPNEDSDIEHINTTCTCATMFGDADHENNTGICCVVVVKKPTA